MVGRSHLQESIVPNFIGHFYLCFTIIVFPESITGGSTVGTSKFSLVLILLIIISSVQNYACEVDCTDHYHIAFEQNTMPVLVRTFTISILGELPKSTNFSKLYKIYFCNFMWPAKSNLIYYYFRLV